MKLLNTVQRPRCDTCSHRIVCDRSGTSGHTSGINAGPNAYCTVKPTWVLIDNALEHSCSLHSKTLVDDTLPICITVMCQNTKFSTPSNDLYLGD